ncbi:hypothetical protein Moror_14259 [Moniliophthora roreri MCA 2997]|uniref:Uncharacterized protein n=2 Tax=Moniliophthora roreri TaxID=221103 RepID=V2XQA0_MONRO|nr:hypothetical protein Moror_14259 [Moniliophthora roreri MCA 2997]
MSLSPPIIMDDLDPSIRYFPEHLWDIEGSSNEFNFSTHSAFTANVSLTLTFHGIAIGVYGTIDPTSPGSVPITRYSVDDGPATIFTPPRLDALAYQQPFYQSPVLEDREHTLRVSLVSHGIPFWLDYFNITPGILASISQSTPSMTLPSTTSTPTEVKSNKTRFIGGVVGGVLGALLLLALTGIFIVRRRKHEEHPLVLPYHSESRELDSTTQGRRMYNNRKTLGGGSTISTTFSTLRGDWESAIDPPSYRP